MEKDEILTISEVARYLKISKSKIYMWVQQNKIPHIKIGRNVRVKVADLNKWLDKQEVKVIS